MVRTERLTEVGPDADVELTVSAETVCDIVIKARRFDVKVPPEMPDPASNASDDESVSPLADYADDPAYQELAAAIEALNHDERLDMVALTWVGRGDFDSFEEARRQAAGTRDRHTTGYLTGIPLLATHLEEGLSQLGYSCEDIEAEHP